MLLLTHFNSKVEVYIKTDVSIIIIAEIFT